MDLLSEIGGLFAQQGLYEATLRISVVFVLGEWESSFANALAS